MAPARLHLAAGLVLVLVVLVQGEQVVQSEESAHQTAGLDHIEGADDVTVVEESDKVTPDKEDATEDDGKKGNAAVTVSSTPETSRTSSASPGGPDICALCSCSTAEGVLAVDCRGRQIDNWPAFTPNSSSLMTVDLSNNSLTSLPLLPELPITSLDLSSNSLSSLAPHQFAPLAPTLLRLDLSGNRLSVAGLPAVSLHLDGLDGQEERFTTWRLQELRLADNRLHSLPHDLLAQLGMLETLDLSSNPLADLDHATAGAIGGVASLQSLSLASCQLSSLPPGLLASLTQLGTLDLSDNSFTVVDPLLRTAPSLHSLALDRNLLESLEDTSFQGLEDLRHLSVCGNPHLRLVGEGAMAPLAQLEELRLSDNTQLAWLHPDAWPSAPSAPFPLRILDLSNNALRYLPSMLLPSFKDWEVLEELELGGNLWECDCHNQWMITTLLPPIEARSPQRASKIVCSGPSKSSLVKVGMVEVSKMSINHTTDLPCDQSMFDPYKRDFNLWTGAAWRETRSPGHGLALGVGAVCVLAVVSTAALVALLHSQRSSSRGGRLLRFPRSGRAPHVPYTQAEGLVGVRCSAGTGIVNPEFRDTEQEMKEMAEKTASPYSRPSAKVIDWPGPPSNLD